MLLKEFISSTSRVRGATLVLMTIHLDLRVVELLASRLCHDLVSPIGAINNGLELLAEDPEAVDDAVDLSRGSARQASGLLQFYRLAYGQAGHRLGETGQELYDVAAAFTRAHKSRLDWRADEGWATAPPGLGKLALNMVATAAEALPRGGEIVVALQEDVRGAAIPTLVVTAQGRGARLRETDAAALAGTAVVEDLTPHSVQGYWTRTLAEDLGLTLSAYPQPSGPDTHEGCRFDARAVPGG